MARFAVGVLAVVGLLLAAAGLFVALAVGLPALGLNPYGRNPLDETLRGLGTALTLYAIGAALLASATRWMRNQRGPLGARRLLALGGAFASVFAVLSIWMAVLGYWLNIPLLLFFLTGILAPAALGVWPPSGRQIARVRS